MKNKLLLFIVLSIGFIVLNLACCNSKSNVDPLTKSWEKAVPNQKAPKGLSSLSAKQCGACHQDHYKEWRQSTHSHAWTDLQFQSELKKESSPFMCINCHIPLQNQQEFIVEGLIDGDIYKPVKKKNPHFDFDLQQEGINCAGCHVRNNAVIGPTGTNKAPHKTVKDPKFLSESLCISCHNAVAVITPTLACSFETGDEWKAGPYFEKRNCISCHMDTLTRSVVPGFAERLSHRHFFAGSGIPKFDTVETNIMNGLAIYPSQLKSAYYKNDSIVFTLRVKNEFAGHRIPTGDPERFFNILFELKNKAGKIVSTQTERIGEHWEWHPEAKKVGDNNLDPKEERTFIFSYQAKESDELTLTVRVTKHRLSKKSAHYNDLKDNYPLFITIFDEAYVVKVR